MGFFDNFKIKKLKNGISVRYKDNAFLSVSTKTLLQVIADSASKRFLSSLVNITKGVDLKPIDDELIKKATQLSRAYITRRKRFYNNRSIKKIDKDNKEFHYFVKAVVLVKDNKTNYKTFLDAQVEGLSFVNGGKGVFPRPSQLSGSGAEDRLFQYLKDDSEENDPEEFKRIELTYTDRNTVLADNPTYQARYKEMKKKKATLQHAYFVYDCQIALKGYATDFVEEYIGGIES